jgi:aryl-alcohol dehydrogenase-like predicted oxidoreductase
MQSRRFGNTDLTVSEVGVGCARIGGVFEGGGRKATLAMLQRAVDEGINFFDTADMYTQGESERLLGEALGRNRTRVVIATKFGYLVPRQRRLVARLKPLLKPLVARLGVRRRSPAGSSGSGFSSAAPQDFSATYIVSALEASLRRLKTDYVDVYQLHSPPRDVLERGEFVEPLERLREQGKIRYWGMACEEPEDVLTSLRYQTIASVQVSLSALEQAALPAAIPRASARGVGIIGRQVFASGLLTRQLEAIDPRYLGRDATSVALKRSRLEQFASVAERSGRSRAELALQFSLDVPGVSAVLLGLSRMDQLDASLDALRARGLTDDERDLLRH